MFMGDERLPVVRDDPPATRRSAVRRSSAASLQQGDFEGIFEAMAGLQTIRPRPPLHEFLPRSEATSDAMRDRIASPRGEPDAGAPCRLGLQFPDLRDAGARDRARHAPSHDGLARRRSSRSCTRSLVSRRSLVSAELTGAWRQSQRRVPADDDEPRARRTSGRDRRRQTSSYSGRTTSADDARLRATTRKFLTYYLEHGILERNPYEVIDEEGVGELMRIAVERGRGAKPAIKLGICGEHGGEPHSVAFCHRLGLDYVSCSPYRVPLARLAAAQAALAEAGVIAVAVGG
jgi:pyruvate,orthophosphate dikinase